MNEDYIPEEPTAATEGDAETAAVESAAEVSVRSDAADADDAVEREFEAVKEREKNPFDSDGFHGEVVTEAVILERKLP